MDEEQSGADVYQQLGSALREVTKLLHIMDIDADERLRLTRKLLAITNVGKHDVTTATKRLRALKDDIQRASNPPQTNENGPTHS